MVRPLALAGGCRQLTVNAACTGAAISDLELARDLLVEGKREWGEEFSKQDEDTYGSKRIRLIEARATGSSDLSTAKLSLSDLLFADRAIHRNYDSY